GADGKLPRTSRGTRQQKSGDIRARYQQNETYGAQKNQQRRAHVAIDKFREGNGEQTPTGCLRIALRARIVADLLRGHFEEGRCVRGFHSSLQPRDRKIVLIENVVEDKGIGRKAQRSPKIGLARPL